MARLQITKPSVTTIVQGAEQNVISYTAGAPLSGHRAVVMQDDGTINYADNTNPSHAFRVIGITTGAIASDVAGDVRIFGRITEPSWSWAIGDPVYLSTAGMLTQTPPAAGFLLKIGCPEASDTLLVKIGEPIILA